MLQAAPQSPEEHTGPDNPEPEVDAKEDRSRRTSLDRHWGQAGEGSEALTRSSKARPQAVQQNS